MVKQRKFEHGDYEWFDKEKNIHICNQRKKRKYHVHESLIESSRRYPLHHYNWLNNTHVYCFIPYLSKKKHPYIKVMVKSI